MDWSQLQALVAVARAGSFTRAARALHLTQPGVSRQVQKLEHELGVPLLLRAHGTVQLTPAGERFRDYASGVLDRYQELLHELRAEAALPAGELRIVASTTPGEFLVPGLVTRFTGRYPDVRPEVFIADSTIVVAELRERRWDVGFTGARLPGRGLRYLSIFEDEVVLAVPAGHPFAARGEVNLEALAGQPFIDREGGSGTILSVRRILGERGLALPAHRTVIVLNTTQAIVSAVENGHGVGWVSSLALADRRPERVAAVRLADIPLRRTLYLVHGTQQPLPPVPAAFVAWVRGDATVYSSGPSRTTGGG